MEEQWAFLFAVSSAVLVGYGIVLLFLMVFLTVLCFLCCRKSIKSSEERRPLLGSRRQESTQEDSIHSPSTDDPDKISEKFPTYGTQQPRSTTGSIDIKQPRKVQVHTRLHQEEPPISTNGVAQLSDTPPRQAEVQPAPTDDGRSTTEEWLTTENFRDVINAVWQARLKWYWIGIQLGLQLVQLQVIEHDNPRSTDDCMKAMIQAWLKQEGATWKELISALKHETVEYHDVASSITAKYIGKEFTAKIESISNSSASSSPVAIMSRKKDSENDPLYSDSAYSTDSSFENLDTSNLTDVESSNLKARLRQDTRRIVTDFSDLVIHMRKSFKQRNVNPQALVTTVKGIAMCERSTQSLQKKLKIQEITSIDMLVAYLLEEGYISFINYFLVEYMIKHHGTEQDKRMLEEYKAKFEAYCKRSVFEVPQDVFGCVPSDGKKLVFKVDDDSILLDSASYSPNEGVATSKNFEPSLGDAQFIQEKVSEALDLKVGSLLLVGASRGCVELTFSAPKIVVEQIQSQLQVNGPVHRILEEKRVHLLCGPPGKPPVTKVRNICYRLQWTKPSYRGFHPIRHYKISYRSVQDPPKVWKTFETEGPTESIALPDEIIHPQNESTFVFKVQAVTEIGSGLYSEESDPVILQPLRATHTPHYPSRTLPRSISHHAAAAQLKRPLTIDDLQEVMDKLNAVMDPDKLTPVMDPDRSNPVKERWYDIGRKLGMNVMTLDKIQRTCKTSNIRLRHMIHNWLSQGGATREALSSALDSLDLYDASDSISARTPYASATNSPSRSRSNTSIPFITLSSSSSCTTEADAPYHHTLPMISSRSRSFSERHAAQENHSLTSDDLLK